MYDSILSKKGQKGSHGNLPVQDTDGIIAQIHSASILWPFGLLPMPPRVKQGEIGAVVAVACSNV